MYGKDRDRTLDLLAFQGVHGSRLVEEPLYVPQLGQYASDFEAGVRKVRVPDLR